MVTVKSRVYFNQALKFGEETISFKNGVAQISDELWNEILESKFPNIYKSGEEPEYRTKLEEKLRSEVKEGNQEFIDEINRLKRVIEGLKADCNRKDSEIAAWKKCVEDLKNQKQVIISTEEKEVEKTETEVKTEDVDDELKKELQGTKKADLIELAKSEDGGNYTDEEIEGKTKEELVNMILERVK